MPAATRKKTVKNYAESGDDDSGSDAIVSLHSDSLDDETASEQDSDASPRSSRKNLKRKRPSEPKASSPRKKRSSPKKKTSADEDDRHSSDDDLGGEQEVVGKIVKAPTTGIVPKGQISQNTFDFLGKLRKPECNDRTWFKLHEPVYRQAEKEWKDWLDEFTPLLIDQDGQIPALPPNDVLHRIYRDVRFSNDKTPYKTGFSATFSRGGRKSIFAGFKPGGSMLAAGVWCPDKNELATIRSHILRNPTPFRNMISSPDFVAHFGPAHPAKNKKVHGGRQNVFGRDDELKVAPKIVGVDKTHPDIDLLKLRSLAVAKKFDDSEVLAEDFKEKLCAVVKVLVPFVHMVNDMMTIPPDDESGDEA